MLEKGHGRVVSEQKAGVKDLSSSDSVKLKFLAERSGESHRSLVSITLLY